MIIRGGGINGHWSFRGDPYPTVVIREENDRPYLYLHFSRRPSVSPSKIRGEIRLNFRFSNCQSRNSFVN